MATDDLSGQQSGGQDAQQMLQHQAVLDIATVDGWFTDPDGIYIDGTFGRGGHSRLLLARLSTKARLLVIDRDPEAIAEAEKLAAEFSQVEVERSDFAQIAALVAARNWQGKVSGILLDLGVSSPQLDAPERGFSFMRDGELDMRMDPSVGQSAAQWLAVASVDEIRDVIKQYGEEKFATRIARGIVEKRADKAITTTHQLAKIIDEAMPFVEKGKHPATRSFQAIRIYINQELEQLKSFLDGSVDLLSPGGRLAVISFHSLEDRIVKRFIRNQVKGDSLPVSIPVTDDALNKRMKMIVKAGRADSEELQDNPRSRSAILRVAEKL
jgi:16S rRNA (cytosine1402-N4)-methyltransferase